MYTVGGKAAFPFSRTLRSLEDRSPWERKTGFLIVALLLLLWLVWLFLGRVWVTATSDEAVVAAGGQSYSLEAGVDGRVAFLDGSLGKRVEKGDIVVQLDDARARSLMDQEEGRLEALEDERRALVEQIGNQSQVVEELHKARDAELQEASSRTKQAGARARQADADAARAQELSHEGLVAASDLEKLQEEARGSEAALEAAQAAQRSVEHGQDREISEQKAQLLGLQGELERLQGALEGSKHSLQLLAHEVELHRIRAPSAGRLGDLRLLRPGAEVERGDRVGTIVPDGDVTIVAFFDPAQAVGRVQPGQSATVRLHGFPWIQYGTLAAEVVAIASEATEGRVRAELIASNREAGSIPLQHGLPGVVEVEIERVSPFTLIARAAGRRVSRAR